LKCCLDRPAKPRFWVGKAVLQPHEFPERALGVVVSEQTLSQRANMRALEIVRFTEQHSGVSVVASNQALIWAVVRQLGAVPDNPELGRLSRVGL